MRYYKRKYFSKRVMRFCLPPCKMYFRVRAVFEIFDTKVDVETNKALFNRDVWGKAKNILKEILEGHYSDPPKEPMYTCDLDKDHKIMRDKCGIALLKCYIDTNALEGEHSHVNNTFGKRKVGWEFGDNLIAERRHRCNVNAYKKNSSHYPNIEHFDTWLIDLHQTLVEQNHNTLLHPTWVNSSSKSLETIETFGFVSLASKDLQEKINEKVHIESNVVLTKDLKFLSERTGCTVAALPWSTSEEKKLFPKLLLKAQQSLGKAEAETEDIFVQMSLMTLEKVDGNKIMPKLPVHNRTYYSKYKFNKRVRNATKTIEKDVETLNAVNILTTSEIITENNDSLEQLDLTSFNDNNDDERDCNNNDDERDREKTSAAKNYVATHFQQSENAMVSSTPQMPKNLPETFPTIYRPLHMQPSVAGINYNFVNSSASIHVKKNIREKDK